MKNKIISVVLVILVLFACVTPAFAETSVIEISSAKDLISLSKKCRLDSFSTDKKVVLKNDIDLGKYNFTPFPVFCGEFDGNGYKISGINIENSVSENGFFTVLTKNAVVKDLTIEGEFTSDDDSQIIGGIAGTNNGKILDCTFNGSIDGGNYVGLIVGKNTTDGVIESCYSFGTVKGSHYVGGIVGENSGVVSKCINSSFVNTTNEDNVLSASSLPQIDLSNLNSTTNTPLTTDIGGIAGYSSGLIEYCENNANVGYQHVGYNIGGIAGRHFGLLISCKNSGEIQGRKDVGGICGQTVPDIDLDFNSDDSQKLMSEILTLQNMINDKSAEFSSNSKNISAHMDNISSYVKNAGESAENIYNTVLDDTSQNTAQIKTLLVLVEKYQSRLDKIINGCDDIDEYIENVQSDLDNAEKKAEDSDNLSKENLQMIESIKKQISSASSDLRNAKAALTELKQLILDGNFSKGEAERLIDETVEYLNSAVDAINGILPYIRDLADNLEKIYGNTDETVKYLKSALNNLKTVADLLSETVSDIKLWRDDLSKEKVTDITLSSSELTKNTENLQSGINGIGNEILSLNDYIGEAGNDFQSFLNSVNSQLSQITALMLSVTDDVKNTDASNIYTDISDETVYSSTKGKTSTCINYGDVKGDVNVGGIVGTMALEYDFDPEDDITSNGSTSSNFKLLSKAILMNSKNYASVTSKKDCAGGITGYADLGIIFNCEGYGTIESSSGNYVGAIAGKSKSNIRECYAKAKLSGNSYVAGIVGEGETVKDCVSFVKIEKSTDKSAMIAGKINSSALNNFFVGDGAGIDRISYVSKAEPITFEELCSMQNVPNEFKKMMLNFVVDGEIIKEIDFSYGETVSEENIPDIPQKDGYYSKWSQTDFSNLDFDLTVVAKYYEYLPVVASDELRNGTQSVIIGEGKFSDSDKITLVDSDKSFANAQEIISVSLSGNPTSFRYLPKDEKKYDLYLYKNGKWQKIKTQTFGKYITFDCDDTEFTLCAVKSKENIRRYILYISIALVIIVLCFIIKKVKRRNKNVL